MTRVAPASRWAAAESRVVNSPVDSMTTSTPSSSHGRALGSRSASTAIGTGVEHDGGVDHLDLAAEPTVGGVVAEQVGEGLGRGEVVDGHHLDIGTHGTGPPGDSCDRCARSR